MQHLRHVLPVCKPFLLQIGPDRRRLFLRRHHSPRQVVFSAHTDQLFSFAIRRSRLYAATFVTPSKSMVSPREMVPFRRIHSTMAVSSRVRAPLMSRSRSVTPIQTTPNQSGAHRAGEPRQIHRLFCPGGKKHVFIQGPIRLPVQQHPSDGVAQGHCPVRQTQHVFSQIHLIPGQRDNFTPPLSPSCHVSQIASPTELSFSAWRSFHSFSSSI